MQITPGVTIWGKYQVERPLARGGMGAVWVARHTKLGSAVAIKFLDAHLAAAPALANGCGLGVSGAPCVPNAVGACVGPIDCPVGGICP